MVRLYCALYKQYDVRPGFEEDEFAMPPKLSKATFETLAAEYLSLEKKSMFGDADDAEYERYFALRDVLFAETIFG
jgi:hypothetical protein